jgi:regulator of sigma E protease
LGQEFGFQTGDKFLSVNGKEHKRIEDYRNMKVFFGADIVVERNGRQMEVEVPGDYFRQLKQGRVKFFETRNTVKVDSFSVNDSSAMVSLAQSAGMEKGDIVRAINGRDLFCFADLSETLARHKRDSVTITVERNGHRMELYSRVDTSGRIGFYPGIDEFEYQKTAYSLGSAFKYGSSDAFEALYYNAVGIGKMFKGDINPRESVASPIKIATFFGGTWEWGHFWWLTAILSMVLAFMNILPIPALDGGHLMFVTIESITRRKLSDKFMERAQMVGFFIIMALMVFAFGNDILGALGI